MNTCCIATVESLLTPQDVADILGVSRWTVRDRAAARGVGVRIGHGGGRVTLFTPADVEVMKTR